MKSHVSIENWEENYSKGEPNIETGCSESLWRFHSWRFSKPDWEDCNLLRFPQILGGSLDKKVSIGPFVYQSFCLRKVFNWMFLKLFYLFHEEKSCNDTDGAKGNLHLPSLTSKCNSSVNLWVRARSVRGEPDGQSSAGRWGCGCSSTIASQTSAFMKPHFRGQRSCLSFCLLFYLFWFF